MFDKRICSKLNSFDRVSIPGGRCQNLSIPPSSTPMVFCTPFVPQCFPRPHQRFTCNPCACPEPRACCLPPPFCSAPELSEGQTCPPRGGGYSGGQDDNTDPFQGFIPPCPQQRLREVPAACPTLCTGVKCCRLHANPFPTIQPIQIWGCTPHKFD